MDFVLYTLDIQISSPSYKVLPHGYLPIALNPLDVRYPQQGWAQAISIKAHCFYTYLYCLFEGVKQTRWFIML